VLIALLSRAFGIDWPRAVQLGLLLAQGGEFAFVVLSRGASHGIIAPAELDLLITVIAASMALTPLLAAAGERIVRHWSRHAGEGHRPGEEVRDLTDHVVIAGFGRVGQTVASILGQRGIPFVAIDANPALVSHVRASGHDSVYFGDSRRVEVLRSVGAARARALVITLDDHGASRILARLRPELPHLRIIVRARNRRHARRLEAEGASAVVPETLEGSLQLAGQVLHSLGAPREEIFELLESYRRDDYALLAHSLLPDERQ
jgi:CPA2 family monovalent cation:H+ antiporter-2